MSRAEVRVPPDRELIQALMDNIPESIYFKDKEHRFVRVNRAKAENHGTTPDQMIGKTDFDYYPEETAKKMMKDDERVMSTGEGIINQIEKAQRCGEEERWVSVTKVPWRDQDGEVIGTFGISRDVTHTVRMEKALWKSQEEFRRLFEGSPDGAYLISKEGVYEEVNEVFCRASGYDREDIIGVSVGDEDWLPEEDREKVLENFKRRMSGEDVSPYTIKYTRGGETFYAEINGRLLERDGEIIGEIGTVRDITERKRIEEELKKAKNRFEELFDGANEMIITTDREGYIYDANRRVEEVTGYSREELKGESVLKLVHPDDHDRAIEVWKKVLTGEEPVYEHRFVTRDGEILHVSSAGRPITEDEEIVEIQYNVQDITGRVEAEEALKKSEDRYKRLFGSLTAGVGIVDENEVIQYCNSAFAEIFEEESPEDLIGRSILAYVDEKQKELILKQTEKRKKGEASRYELEIITAKNNRKTIVVSATPRFDDRGKYTGVFGTIFDITERKRIEEALRESEERYRSIVENSHAGILTVGTDYRFQYVNDELCNILGYSRDELVGQDFREFLDEESTKLVADRYKRRRRGEDVPPRYEFNVVRKDGEKRRVEISSSVIEDSGGEIKTVAQILDITERKEMEEALRESEERYRNVIEGANVGIVVYGIDKKIGLLNPAMSEIIGYGREEVSNLGQWLKKLYPDREERVEISRLLLDRVAEDGRVTGTETEIVRKDGDRRTIFFNAVQLESGDVIFFAHDITELREAERALKEVKDRFEELFEGAHELVVTTDPEGYIKRVNRRTLEKSGYERDELIGESVLKVAHPGDRDEFIDFWHEVLEGKRSIHEVRGLTKDGDTIHLLAAGRPIIEDGEIIEIQYNAQDITKLKEAEEEAEREKERYEELFEGANEMIITTDREGYIYDANRRVEEVTGYSEEELKGESILKVAHPGDRDEFIDFWHEVLEGKRSIHEVRGLTKDGDTIHLLAAGRPIIEDGEIIEIQYNAQDISDRVKAERELERRRSQLEEKTKELEAFAYTVSHDLRTPLVSIDGFSDLLIEEFGEKLGDEGKHYVDRIRANIEKMDDFINDILELSRIGRKEAPKEEVDVEEVVEEVLEELSARIEDDGIEVEVGKNLPTFEFERNRLYQIYSNLISNACKYMGDQKNPRIEVGAEERGRNWLLWVRDNGVGINPEDHDRIFRVFEKGKDAGPESTGIGLSTVKKVVESHEGKIWVESEKGEGSTFYFEFPKNAV